ncbi:ABC transporter permease DevC [Aphanothece sacrum]|uniref:ABC transporter n=1 Tax=Aphanothece sacrum FPU1 TaxID=1920663 RepID=A0A401ILG8_APHSA|nr:ABC transporter permease DevC [Aphanothece sacrum]GBF82081.1 ABC transporter [Aphanothece sacrum FPU1]GBF85015.1 ABC transporter [Aphanothece sacrum FPU3]
MRFKLPTAWLQLKHKKMRLLVALAGVIFAVVIVFVQFGLKHSLFESAVRFHQSLQGDVFLISPKSNALIGMEAFNNRRLWQTLAFKEVDFISPIYLGFAQWQNPQDKKYWRKIFIIGIDPRHSVLNLSGMENNRYKLKIPENILFDQNSRSEFGSIISSVKEKGKVSTQLTQTGQTIKINVVGLFELGTSFGADGNILTSDVNFLRIFNKRPKTDIDVGLIKLKSGVNTEQFTRKLRAYLPKDVNVLSKQEYIEFEQNYWNSSTPIGFIFNLGIVLGIVVGIVVVYQILYSNVSEHLSEYATLKAIGYRNNYLLSMILQQATFIAVLGYIPGFLLSMIIYEVAKKATFLPIFMTLQRAIFVFILTLMMCFIAGVTAIKKLKEADPADIF